jgi:hypothetical protein
VLRAVPDTTGRFIRLSAVYIVVAPDAGERPFRGLTSP